MGAQRFTIKSGTSARFACPSVTSPFVLIISSLSEIPDRYNRPVIAKLTGLHAATAAAAPAKPGCVRLVS
jgi:hypothetical protein